MKNYIYLMLCILPLLSSCKGEKQEMPGEKYRIFTVSKPIRHCCLNILQRYAGASL